MLAPVPPGPGPVGTHGDPVRLRTRRVSPTGVSVVYELGRGHDEPFMRGAARQFDRRELEPAGELHRPGVESRAARLQHVMRFAGAVEHFDLPQPVRLRSLPHPGHRILDESQTQHARVHVREEVVRVRAVAVRPRRNRVDGAAGAAVNGMQLRPAGRRRAGRRSGERAAGRRRRRRRESRRRGRVRVVAAGRGRAEQCEGGDAGDRTEPGRAWRGRRRSVGIAKDPQRSCSFLGSDLNGSEVAQSVLQDRLHGRRPKGCRVGCVRRGGRLPRPAARRIACCAVARRRRTIFGRTTDDRANRAPDRSIR